MNPDDSICHGIHLTSKTAKGRLAMNPMDSQENGMKERKAPYPLRMGEELNDRVRETAQENRRSLNAEIGLLIEEGYKWREQQALAGAR